MINKFSVLVFSFVIFSQTSFAEKKQDSKIFKCTNSGGEVFYNDKPCPVNDVEKKLRAVKDPKGLVKNGNNYPTPLNSLEANEQEDSAKMKKEFAIYEKELATKGSPAYKRKEAKEKVDISKMTGSERENYYEKTTAAQKRLTKEGEESQSVN